LKECAWWSIVAQMRKGVMCIPYGGCQITTRGILSENIGRLSEVKFSTPRSQRDAESDCTMCRRDE
jgi:hypothetical protein